MEEKKNKKSKIIKGVALLGLFLLVFGVSYALFSVMLTGKKKNRITTGTLALTLTDELENEESGEYGIDLEGALPISDEEGLQTIPYKFVVTNTGTIPASYKLTLENTKENTLNDNYIKYNLVEKMYLKKEDGSFYNGVLYNTEPRKLDTLNNRELHSTTILPGQKVEYTLNLWLDEKADNGAMDKEFEAKIKIDGIQGNAYAKGKAGDNVNYTLYKDGTLIYTGNGQMKGYDEENAEINNNGTALIDVIVKELNKHNLDVTVDATEQGLMNFEVLMDMIPILTTQEFDNVDFNTYNYEKAKTCDDTGSGVPADCTDIDKKIELLLVYTFSNNIEQTKQALNYIREIPKVKDVIVDEKITNTSPFQLIYIGDYMVTLPSTIENFARGSLNGYKGYTIIIPPKVTTLSECGYGTEIKEITIPGTVKTIGENAFYNSYKVKKIIIEEGVEKIKAHAFWFDYIYANTDKEIYIKIPHSVQSVVRPFGYLTTGTIEVDNTKEFVDANWDKNWVNIGTTVKYLR